MRFVVESGFDLFDLFIHDKYDTLPVDEMVVEEQLNKLANERASEFMDGFPHIEFRCPSNNGLSRFTLDIDHKPVFFDRPYKRSDVRDGLKKWTGLLPLFHGLNATQLTYIGGPDCEFEETER